MHTKFFRLLFMVVSRKRGMELYYRICMAAYV